MNLHLIDVIMCAIASLIFTYHFDREVEKALKERESDKG